MASMLNVPHFGLDSNQAQAVQWLLDYIRSRAAEESSKSIQYHTRTCSVQSPCLQSLCQQSKTRTSLTDAGSASGATFQCIQFLPFLSVFSYLFYLGHPSLPGLQRPKDRATFLSSRSSPITRRHPWAPWRSVLCMPSASVQKKVPHPKSGTFWFAWTDSHDSTTTG